MPILEYNRFGMKNRHCYGYFLFPKTSTIPINVKTIPMINRPGPFNVEVEFGDPEFDPISV